MSDLQPAAPDLWQGHRGHSLPRTDLHRCLDNSAADGLTGLSLGLCSLALRYLLPARDLERYLHCLIADAESGVISWDEPYQQRQLLTGSSAEGLSVPTFCRRLVPAGEPSAAPCGPDQPESPSSSEIATGQQPEAAIVTKADTDSMFEVGFLPVSPERGDSRLYMDARGAGHSGYVRVLWDAAWSPPPDSGPVPDISPLLRRPPAASGSPEPTLCLSSDAFMQFWHSRSHYGDDVTVERHGPAINTVQLLHGAPIDFDGVPALPLTRSPPAVRAWLRRVQQAQWPPEDVRRKIAARASGHLVATGHASSARRDLEWRLSFSMVEKWLSRSLTTAQRKVYLLVKLVQKCFLTQPKILVTYHLKTLMFWELETTRHSWSEEHLFSRVLGVLDRIDTCLAEHRVPSYFLPENNLVSDCSAADVAAVRRALHRVRLDPLRSLFAIDSQVRFEFSATRPLLEFHAPLLDAIEAGLGASAAAATLAAGLVRQARDGLARNEHTLVRTGELLRDAWELRQPSGAVRPRYADWLLLTAAAICAATHRDEDAWVRDVLRTQMATTASPELTERHVQVWEAACPSGVTAARHCPFRALMRSCLDEYSADLDRHSIEQIFSEFVASDRPRLPVDALEALMSAELAMEELSGSNITQNQTLTDSEEACEDDCQTVGGGLAAESDSIGPRVSDCQKQALMEMCSVLQQLETEAFDLSAASKATVVKKLMQAGIPKDLAIQKQFSFNEDLAALTLAGWDEFGSAGDHVGLGVQMLHRFELIDSLEAGRKVHVDHATRMEHIDTTNTALLDTFGHLVANGHRTLASRAASWLGRLKAVETMEPVDGTARPATYSLHGAARFLACLPEDIRTLLLMTQCEISLPALVILFGHGVPLLDPAGQDPKSRPEDRVADLLSAWDSSFWSLGTPDHSDGVRLSDAVVKLCLVKMAGGSARQCVDCLRDVEERLGCSATERIRHALM